MTFNSFEFLFLFLPITLMGFFYIEGKGYGRAALSWLILASLFYYGWWNPIHLGLLLGSILFNYFIGSLLGNLNCRTSGKLLRKPLLVVGIVVNLFLLGYLKYTSFLITNLNDLMQSNYHLETIVPPLAISFFTFQQISYLVDAYKNETGEYNFLQYCLFVAFFSKLIAGPIARPKEMLPQVADTAKCKLNQEDLAVGMTMFVFGLFKKVVLADGIGIYSTPVFEAAERGAVLTLFEAWGGALSYTFQLYFDFSGYSDMAIGIARMFGIRLPRNFYSPYKAFNVIEFWRRWHISLSRFLRDYLYIPLGGNRKGEIRRYVNLAITMILAGMWHGAGWTFVAWGALHGIYLSVNHAWQRLRRATSKNTANERNYVGYLLSVVLTFVFIVLAWVFFRAETLRGAINMIKGMIGLNGAVLDVRLAYLLKCFDGIIVFKGTHIGSFNLWGIPWLIFLGIITWIFPNTEQILESYSPVLSGNGHRGSFSRRFDRILLWKPNLLWATSVIMMTIVSFARMSRITEFLYFQF